MTKVATHIPKQCLADDIASGHNYSKGSAEDDSFSSRQVNNSVADAECVNLWGVVTHW